MQTPNLGGEQHFGCNNRSLPNPKIGATYGFDQRAAMHSISQKGWQFTAKTPYQQNHLEQQVPPHQVGQRSAHLHNHHPYQQYQQHARTNKKLDEWSHFGRQKQHQHYNGHRQPETYKHHGSLLTPIQQQQLLQQIEQARQLTLHHQWATAQRSNQSANYNPRPPAGGPGPIPQGYQPVNYCASGEHVDGRLGSASNVLTGPTPPPTPSPGFEHQGPSPNRHTSPTALNTSSNNRMIELLSPPLSIPTTSPDTSFDISSSNALSPKVCTSSSTPSTNRLLKLSEVSLPLAKQSARQRRAELKKLGLPYHSDDDEEEEEEERQGFS